MKKYMPTARLCIKGEAFFELLISRYAIPHHIVGPKDIGLDYICEWAYKDVPSGILFLAQVKTFTVNENNKPKSQDNEADRKKSGLEAFSINNPKLRIDDNTIAYWKGFQLPVYLFAVACPKGEKTAVGEMELYYKRFSDVLTRQFPQNKEWFYRVNEGLRFLAFAKEKPRMQGFARDLFVDLMRWSYFKGSIAWMQPQKLGLDDFADKDAVLKEFFQVYKKQISETFAETKQHIERLEQELAT